MSLRDDLRVYLPEILPRFTSLFQEAEREGSYQMVQPALDALEAIGPTLEDHLQLLLPALVRLVPPGGFTASQNMYLYIHDSMKSIQDQRFSQPFSCVRLKLRDYKAPLEIP